MLRMRLLTAAAATALLAAPAVIAQDQPGANPPNVGEAAETEVNASAPRPNPGEDAAPPAPTEPWTPETPSEDAVAYAQAASEGWSEPDSTPPAGEATMDASAEVEAEAEMEAAPMTPEPDPVMPSDTMEPPAANPMEPPADSTVPPPPIDPAPDAAEDDPMDPTPQGA